MSFRASAGGRVDRTRPLTFTFDGRTYRGIRGRLAGLGAARQRRAPGGPLVQIPSAARHPRRRAEEPNALVTVYRDAARHTPNLRATQVELYDGLQAMSQNRWPSLEHDVGASE